MPGYYLENFGCRATQADGAAIELELTTRGLNRSESSCAADVVVLNTCTVTAAADHDVRARIRRIHRENPGCKIMVTGCYAQRAPQEVAALPGVTWVVGNSHKHEVAGIAASGVRTPAASTCATPGLAGYTDTTHLQLAQRGFVAVEDLASATDSQIVSQVDTLLVGDIFAHTQLMAAPVFESGVNTEKTRPNLKVQDGCDNRCSFCVIPFVRGQSRSLPLESVLQQCNALVAAGYREVVISGINLGRWGRDFGRPARFEELVHAILDCTSLERLRISSVEPMDWSPDLIRLLATEPRICKHAHLPLQSGSDRVLRMMHRKYRPWHYEEKVRAIREAVPDAAIGADVMVGFPGESDELFDENLRFIEALPFTYLHVFTYSSRPGTAAETMPDHVPVHIARQRNKVLRDLAAEKNLRFRQSFLGRTLDCITLHRRDDGSTEALSHNYLKVRIPGEHAPNRVLQPRIVTLAHEALAAAP